MTNEIQPTTAELRKLLFDAIRSTMSEYPRIGGTRAKEWAVSTRVAIHLSRTKAALDAEEHQNILIDAEYGQMGVAGKSKRLMVDQQEKGMKPDVIWHKRGGITPEHNWIACEIKLHNSRGTPRINRWDKEKLQALKKYLHYRLAIWIAIPRTSSGKVAYYGEVDEGGRSGPIRPLD